MATTRSGDWRRTDCTLRRAAAIALTTLVMLAGCGDDAPAAGDGTTAPTATQATAPATPGSGVGTPFCRQAAEQQRIGGDFNLFDPSSVADAFARSLEALRALHNAAPSELRTDLAVLVEFSERYDAVLSRHGHDILVVPEEEFDVLFTPEVIAASERLETYCDLESDGGTGGEQDDRGDPVDADAAIQALMPPGGVIVSTPAPHMAVVQVDLTFDEVVDFYRSLVGAELSLSSAGSFSQALFLGGMVAAGTTASITVSDQPDGPVEIVIAVSP